MIVIYSKQHKNFTLTLQNILLHVIIRINKTKLKRVINKTRKVF